MKSPRLTSADSFYSDQDLFRAGFKLACEKFQKALKREEQMMKKLASAGNEDGCWCMKKCKVEECLNNW